MKVTKTITINAETWTKCKDKTDSISGTINFLLDRWLETEAENYERNKINTMKNELEKERARVAAIQKEMEDLKQKQPKIIKVIGGNKDRSYDRRRI